LYGFRNHSFVFHMFFWRGMFVEKPQNTLGVWLPLLDSFMLLPNNYILLNSYSEVFWQFSPDLVLTYSPMADYDNQLWT
jgi:hypothetical protein